ncbi:MAG: hypothetical protein IPI73_30295 [Betaproteobacteria bacterium]|nr:hypothetical protein [Betaproteobacteria bacterium]
MKESSEAVTKGILIALWKVGAEIMRSEFVVPLQHAEYLKVVFGNGDSTLAGLSLGITNPAMKRIALLGGGHAYTLQLA